MADVVRYAATGRRKTSVARVSLIPGNGNVVINKINMHDYFGQKDLVYTVLQPVVAAKIGSNFDIIVNVRGGGLSGQAGAIRHGIARALVKFNSDLRGILRSFGFLTRDARMKERKKYGLKAARKAPQFSKR
jgi:small subunit ribosomal protein S9